MTSLCVTSILSRSYCESPLGITQVHVERKLRMRLAIRVVQSMGSSVRQACPTNCMSLDKSLHLSEPGETWDTWFAGYSYYYWGEGVTE